MGLVLPACGSAKTAAGTRPSASVQASTATASLASSPSPPNAGPLGVTNTSSNPAQGAPTGSAPAHSAPGGGSGSGCTLSVIESVAGESSAEDNAKSPGWGPIRANGWTAFVPGGDWVMTASDAGADIMSPDGKSDSSLEEWDAQVPLTVAGLQNQLLAPVGNVQTICTAGAETTGNTHATEFTGTFGGEAIHGVIIVSLLAPTMADLYQAQTRSMYSPVATWTDAEATTLMVISKRAIESPNALPIPQN